MGESGSSCWAFLISVIEPSNRFACAKYMPYHRCAQEEFGASCTERANSRSASEKFHSKAYLTQAKELWPCPKLSSISKAFIAACLALRSVSCAGARPKAAIQQ